MPVRNAFVRGAKFDVRSATSNREHRPWNIEQSWHDKTVWVFDFDGTLVDSMTHFADLAARVIAQYYGTAEAIAREQYRQTSGWPFVEQIERLYPGDPQNTTAVAAFESAKTASYFDRPLFPETRATIETLRARGCCVAISSNNIQSLVEAYCRAHALPVDIVCGWTPTFCKGPAHFTHIAAATDRSTDHFIFVGDSLKDARTAATYGIPFVARAGTFSAAEFQAQHPTVPVVHSLTELL